MTSAQTMLDVRRLRTGVALALTWVLVLWPLGCAGRDRDRLEAPDVLMAPYDAARGDALWAVVPLRNESATSLVDVFAVSDAVVSAAQEIRGVRCLPLNRTIDAMRAKEIESLETPEDARALAAAMGVDGVIVGSITAYDPYDPPTLGLSLALYARDGHLSRLGDASLDTRRLTYQPTEWTYFPGSGFENAPASVVSEHLDANNHQVLMDVKAYARGRHDSVSALGWRRYTASMDLYTRFAAHHTVSRLIQHEWIRLAREGRRAAGTPR